jgi:hypothetical protein
MRGKETEAAEASGYVVYWDDYGPSGLAVKVNAGYWQGLTLSGGPVKGRSLNEVTHAFMAVGANRTAVGLN